MAGSPALSACREQQQEEMEALEAIYGSSFERLGANQFRFVHPLSSQQDTPTTFTVTYPASYPRVAPDLDISIPGLPPLLVRHALNHVREALPSLVGDPCVFQLTAVLEEAFEDGASFAGPEQSVEQDSPMTDKATAENASADAEAIDGMLPGDPTTPESFASWWKAFRKAHGIVLESDPERLAEEARLRPSGRQIWLEKLRSGVPFVDEEV